MKPSNVLIKELSKKLDGLVNLPGILEWIDGPTFKFVLKQLRNKYWDNVPEVHQRAILAVIEGFVADDYSEIDKSVETSINHLVDLPWVEGENEALVVSHMVQLLMRLILSNNPKNAV